MSFDTPSRTPDAETPAGTRRDPSEDVVDDPTAPDAAVDGESLDDDDLDDGFELEGDYASADSEEGDDDEDSVLYEDQVQPEYGILGFTLRELIIVGSWLVAFVVSFFSIVSGLPTTIWGSGIGWILTVGVPTAAVFLIVLRRFSPQGIRRVGSLGIDQFASVAASVAAVAWAQLLWDQVTATVQTGTFLVGWPVIVAQLATLALVAATTAAPLIPRLREDFEGRVERLAHRSANPVRPVISRPRPVATTLAVATTPAVSDGDVVSAEPTAVEVPQPAQPEWDLEATHVIPRLDSAAAAPLAVPPVAVSPVVDAPAPPAPPAPRDQSDSESTGADENPSTAAESESESAEAPSALGEPSSADEPSALPEQVAPPEPVTPVEPISAIPAAEEPAAEIEAPTTVFEAPTTVIDDSENTPPRFGERLPAAESVPSTPAADPSTMGASDAGDPAFADSAPIEVYNTGAVEVLQQIFEAGGAETPIAMDSSDTGTIGPEHADRPVLRRDRAEQARAEQFEPEPAPVPQPFWILARTERDVLDELGRPLFRIGPTDWTLVIEDRGGAFVVRHEDGRIGYLRDMSDITKG